MAFTRDSFIDPFNDSIQGLCKWRKIESISSHEMDSSYREYHLDLQIFSSIKGGRDVTERGFSHGFLVKPNHRGQSNRARECLNIPVSKIAANGGWTVLIEKYRFA